MRWKAIVVLLLLVGGLYAQDGVVQTATQFIVDKKFDAVHTYLDSILKTDSRNVDALMMKGNVILNKELTEQPDIALLGNIDEDFYKREAGAIEENIKVVSADIAAQVAAFWKQALAIDSARLDIHRGLCTLYAMALMKEELKKQLAVLIRVEGGDEERAYSLAEYARKFKERGRFSDAMHMYEFIAAQFPDLAGIRCDIGWEYFYNGQLNLGLQWVDSAFRKTNIDETTYLNGAFLYSQLAYFDNAQKLLDEYSVKFNRNMGHFYKGLRLFAEMDSRYADTLNYFIAVSDTNAYHNEITLAKSLAQFKDTLTMNNYRQLVESEIPEYYRVLIYQRGVKQFADSCEAYIRYGAFNNLIKNYSASVQFLEEGEDCAMDSMLADYQAINYGFALYMMAQNDKALQALQRVLNSKNVYRKQAANYFTAKILMSKKRSKEAVVYLQKVIEDKNQTKYQALAKAMLPGEHK